MIILPDRSLSQSKLLMPIPKWQWREPSVALDRDQFNNKVVRTFFRLTARLADGHVVWRGQFEDRDDADAFLFALASGSLRYERDLWRLPTPEWHPGLGDELFYKLAVTSFLTGTGSALTYNVPADWNNSDNVIRCIGGGASGGVRRSDTSTATRNAAGGGGGGYGSSSNITLTPGGTATYGIIAGGTSVTRSTNGQTNGNAGGESYFNGTSYTLAATGGDGGNGGGAGNTTLTAAGGGTGKGTTTFTGGEGGAVTSSSGGGRATGGGGAAGGSGDGNNGVSLSATGGSDGGSGNAGSGGAAGTGNGAGNGSAGGNGTEIQVSPAYGSGGGGGGALSSSTVSGGSGGTYGAAGGGCSALNSTGTSGTGRNGLIVVEYTPAATSSLANNNLPMLGM